MNEAQILILAVGSVLSPTVFLLMRYPRFRRAQYQGTVPFSFSASLLLALAVFALFVFMAHQQ